MNVCQAPERAFAAVRFAVAALAIASSACGSKGAVALTAHIENPELTVQQAALGTGIAGSFELVLDLGEYADEGTEVSLVGFGLVRDSQEIVSALELAPQGVTFPVRVEPGKSKRVVLTHADSQTYDASVGTALCSGSISYRGAVRDSLSDDKTTAASSNDFTAACP